MRKFDTKVQHLKYKVLREVARQAWNDTLLENVLDIPKAIVPGKVPTMRCCVYKERAILAERVKLAMGGGNSGNIIQVIDIACDDCPAIGYQVTDSCRYVGKKLLEMRFKPNTRLACINRMGRIIIPGGSDTLEVGDTVVVIAASNRVILDLNDVFADEE